LFAEHLRRLVPFAASKDRFIGMMLYNAGAVALLAPRLIAV